MNSEATEQDRAEEERIAAIREGKRKDRNLAAWIVALLS